MFVSATRRFVPRHAQQNQTWKMHMLHGRSPLAKAAVPVPAPSIIPVSDHTPRLFPPVVAPAPGTLQWSLLETAETMPNIEAVYTHLGRKSDFESWVENIALYVNRSNPDEAGAVRINCPDTEKT
jgi:hypothetical protein